MRPAPVSPDLARPEAANVIADAALASWTRSLLADDRPGVFGGSTRLHFCSVVLNDPMAPPELVQQAIALGSVGPVGAALKAQPAWSPALIEAAAVRLAAANQRDALEAWFATVRDPVAPFVARLRFRYALGDLASLARRLAPDVRPPALAPVLEALATGYAAVGWGGLLDAMAGDSRAAEAGSMLAPAPDGAWRLMIGAVLYLTSHPYRAGAGVETPLPLTEDLVVACLAHAPDAGCREAVVTDLVPRLGGAPPSTRRRDGHAWHAVVPSRGRADTGTHARRPRPSVEVAPRRARVHGPGGRPCVPDPSAMAFAATGGGR